MRRAALWTEVISRSFAMRKRRAPLTAHRLKYSHAFRQLSTGGSSQPAVPDEHAQNWSKPISAFQAALHVAIAAGHERIEAVEATVQLKPRRTTLPR
jgi:hypothetical protein